MSYTISFAVHFVHLLSCLEEMLANRLIMSHYVTCGLSLPQDQIHLQRLCSAVTDLCCLWIWLLSVMADVLSSVCRVGLVGCASLLRNPVVNLLLV
jgi:hypothetical protein